MFPTKILFLGIGATRPSFVTEGSVILIGYTPIARTVQQKSSGTAGEETLP
jgi:hypothetical protein